MMFTRFSGRTDALTHRRSEPNTVYPPAPFFNGRGGMSAIVSVADRHNPHDSWHRSRYTVTNGNLSFHHRSISPSQARSQPIMSGVSHTSGAVHPAALADSLHLFSQSIPFTSSHVFSFPRFCFRLFFVVQNKL